MIRFFILLAVAFLGLAEASDAWTKQNRQLGGISRDNNKNNHNGNWGRTPRGNSGWIQNDKANKEVVKRKACSRCGREYTSSLNNCSYCDERNKSRSPVGGRS